MTCLRLLTLGLVLTLAAGDALADKPPETSPRLAFYAFDNCFTRSKLTMPEQLDLLKELGFDGIAWREQKLEQVRAVVEESARRGLKIHTIYCAAKVTPEGELTHSAELVKMMEVLKGTGTIVWLHIGGKGPAFDTLNEQSPVVVKLRSLSDSAAANGLRIAIYPHYGEWTARFADAIALAKVVNHKQFGVTFNLCHALAGGEGKRIDELLEQARPFLMTVTICGADAGVEGPQWNRLIQTLDKGSFDVRQVLRKLGDIGFSGPVGFQGYNIPGDARSILTPTMAAWGKMTAPAGGQR